MALVTAILTFRSESSARMGHPEAVTINQLAVKLRLVISKINTPAELCPQFAKSFPPRGYTKKSVTLSCRANGMRFEPNECKRATTQISRPSAELIP